MRVSGGADRLCGCRRAQSFVVVVAQQAGRNRRLDQCAAAERVVRALPAGPEPAHAHLPDARPDRGGPAPPAGQGPRGPDLFGGREPRDRAAARRQIRAEGLARRLAERQRQGEPRADQPADRPRQQVQGHGRAGDRRQRGAAAQGADGQPAPPLHPPGQAARVAARDLRRRLGILDAQPVAGRRGRLHHHPYPALLGGRADRPRSPRARRQADASRSTSSTSTRRCRSASRARRS